MFRGFAFMRWMAMAAVLSSAVWGCTSAQYVTPGGPADFRALGISKETADSATDASIASRLNRVPAAAFPASLAMIRVQAGGYYSRSTRGYGDGRFSVVTARDVETAEQMKRIQQLPLVRGVAPMNRLVVPGHVNTDLDLRSAAADVQADIVLLYTFDTVFSTETTIPALGVLTLGLFPNEQARVSSTASAAFIDTRTGYVYGVAESTSKTTQLANAWTSEDAVDQSRRRAETEAFASLVGEMESLWSGIVARYGPPSSAPSDAPAQAPPASTQAATGGGA